MVFKANSLQFKVCINDVAKINKIIILQVLNKEAKTVNMI